MRPLLHGIVSAIVIGACAEQQPRESRPAADTPPPAVAARDSEVPWIVRPIVNAPRFFVLSGWVNDGTLWGLAGDNPVDIDVRTGAGTARRVRVSGAVRSPDNAALAWGDPSGLWIMRRGGHARRILTYSSISQPPPGDPTNELRWAPNGRRLLTSWRDEGIVTHVLVDTTSGGFEPIYTRLPGYGEAAKPLWLDDRRILFSTAALAAKDGSTGYRESGWRADIAVHDLGTHTYEKVTDVSDGTFLDLAGELPDTIVVRRRTTGDTLWTFSLFDTRTWEERPTALPRGSSIAVAQGGLRAAVLRPNDRMSEVIIRSRRAGTPDAAPVFIPGRITGTAWSPNGRSFAVSTLAEAQVPGTPGDLQTTYRLFVIESGEP
ncbi:MAG: hypothetical protein M3125_03130 [Gemmatimonadota bacterium]|nr:hypothetical protein [Gemmatimonadota bacterium]